MTLLKRLKIQGTTLSILENENEITIEIHPDIHSHKKEKLIEYLHDEGILEEILAGNTNW